MGLLSDDEFAFFPFAFFGGTLWTRLLIAALLLAHGDKYDDPSAFRLPSVNLKNKAVFIINIECFTAVKRQLFLFTICYEYNRQEKYPLYILGKNIFITELFV